jgi:hypothetical protein
VSAWCVSDRLLFVDIYCAKTAVTMRASGRKPEIGLRARKINFFFFFFFFTFN